MELGLSPEGCSAFMFPKIMGYSRVRYYDNALMNVSMCLVAIYVQSLQKI